MNIFDVLKRKKEDAKLDIPPPPPIKQPMIMPRPIFNIPRESMPVNVPRFEPRSFPMSIPKMERPTQIEARAPLFMQKTPQFPKLAAPRQEKISEQKEIMMRGGSYIRADSFKDVLEHINEIKRRINESEGVLVRLNEIKNREDKEFENWSIKFEDVQRKLNYIDRTFFG